ncbi:methylmalonyl-CoA epimerase [Nocardia pseudobrasiliensis]|uniref:Methylmalonyl-CoA epimerase n=1 Tax=Nocardia pseudobrasiliensis TaxID=45979 RepID=A0A370IEA5_9NOCA|nr:methylmalonyl-CoA epimerase [Nocardia pseudobrasiliensis]RDI69057.1 methylmalonyl-CoA epimerase [Nocardia pseudobrasiliensis]
MLTRVDHIGIACADLDEAIRFHRVAYGFDVCYREINDDQGVDEAMLRINGTDDGHATYLQLLSPTRPDSPVGKFLATRGPGVHHIAFGTPDVDAAAAAFRQRGMGVLFAAPRPAAMGSRATFLHPRDCGGVLVELVTHG